MKLYGTYLFPFILLLALLFSCNGSTSHSTEEPDGPSFDTVVFQQRGADLVLATKQQLSKNLVGALTDGGTQHALEFCSSKALALTDSMSDVLQATVRRVSDQPRNPANEATGQALAYIQHGKDQLAKGYQLTPELHATGDKVVGYYPILTNALCLQCHGQPNEQILPGSLQLIDSLYPQDHAKGYAEGELRGAFVVEMGR